MALAERFIGKPIRKLNEDLGSSSTIVAAVEVTEATDAAKAIETIKRSIADKRASYILVAIKV